jgi:hypothetical protein
MRVVGGRPLRKNNWRPDQGDYYVVRQDEIALERRPPGEGYRHVVSIPQLRAFVELLPDWDEVALGLRGIVLDVGQAPTMGWYNNGGVVAVCAWERQLWWHHSDPWFEDTHGDILDLLHVERTRKGDHYEIHWTEEQARAFQLLHILPHEVGHHHDRMTTRRKSRSGRGEPYAETYALWVLDVVWPSYARRFGL